MTPPKFAETVDVDLVVTFIVFTENVTDVFPTGIVTVAGTVAEELLFATSTVSPPVGAGELMVTVPVDVFPPVTETGLNVNETSCGGNITRDAVSELPPAAAVRIAIF